MESGEKSWITPKLSAVGIPRRRQINSETPTPSLEYGPVTPSPAPPSTLNLQMNRLQEQIQYLTDMMEDKIVVSGSNETVERLSEENSQLSSLLKDSDTRLTNLQEGVVELQDEYNEELSELKEQITELTNAIEEKEFENNRISQEFKKLSSAKQSLESYIHTLPSDTEYKDLKRKLKRKENELLNATADVASLKSDLKSLQKEKDSQSSIISDLKEQNAILAEQLQKATKDIESHRKARFEAQNLGNNDKENILIDRANLSDENCRLKDYISLTKEKYKKQIDLQSVKYKEVEDNLALKLQELDEIQRKFTEEVSTNKFLREDLTQSKGKVGILQVQIEDLKSKLIEIDGSDAFSKELEKCYQQLFCETGKCIQDLQAISNVARQINEGEDPNVSMLLGTRNISDAFEETDDQEKSLSYRVAKVKQQLEDVKNVRLEVSAIRDRVSKNYAENIGENMTSCVTQ